MMVWWYGGMVVWWYGGIVSVLGEVKAWDRSCEVVGR